MNSVFPNQYHAGYNETQYDNFVASNINDWPDLIDAFKTLIGFGDPECAVYISFNRDIPKCGSEDRDPLGGFTLYPHYDDDDISEIIKAIALYGCGCWPPPPWPITNVRPERPCTECFGTTPQLLKVQNFLNEVIITDPTSEEYNDITYDFNGFLNYTARPATSNLEAIYGSGLIPLVPTGYKWDNTPPNMDHIYKLDVLVSGVPVSSIIFGFDNPHPSHRFYFIRSFSNIRPSCPNPQNHFAVDVEIDIYDPYALSDDPPERVTMTIQGYIMAPAPGIINFVKKFSCCVKLCNKPAVPQIEAEACGAELQLAADLNAVNNYTAYMENMRNKFRELYISQCLNARISEQFMMKYNNGEYHYTLYYYDLAGNLVKTVPPEGIKLLTTTGDVTLADAKAAREDYDPDIPPVVPPHELASHYQYNSLNQLIRQKTPDAGISEFYYDELGRIVFSQNAKQKAQAPLNVYSYTLYDPYVRSLNVTYQTPCTPDATW